MQAGHSNHGLAREISSMRPNAWGLVTAGADTFALMHHMSLLCIGEGQYRCSDARP